MFFVPLGHRKDDIRLTVTQIIMMQSAHYFVLGLLFTIIGTVSGVNPTVEQFFSYKAFNIFSKIGIVSIIAWVLNSFAGYVDE
jgi:hypothetical protein